MHKFSWQVWTALGFLIFGILAMTQFKAQEAIVHNNPANLRSEDIIGTLIQVEQDSADMEKEADSLTARIKDYQNSSNLVSSLEDELNSTKMRAGLDALRGPGLTVTLNDSELKREQGTDPNNYYIHESFLREIVNAFWTGGAEAVAVNDQRFVANTEIFCGGTTIFINKSLVAPPYRLVAIGDPQALNSSINMDVLPFLTSMQQQYGIKVDVKQGANLIIPAYKEFPQFHFAVPVGVK